MHEMVPGGCRGTMLIVLSYSELSAEVCFASDPDSVPREGLSPRPDGRGLVL
jgi:hypothetical protein